MRLSGPANGVANVMAEFVGTLIWIPITPMSASVPSSSRGRSDANASPSDTPIKPVPARASTRGPASAWDTPVISAA